MKKQIFFYVDWFFCLLVLIHIRACQRQKERSANQFYVHTDSTAEHVYRWVSKLQWVYLFIFVHTFNILCRTFFCSYDCVVSFGFLAAVAAAAAQHNIIAINIYYVDFVCCAPLCVPQLNFAAFTLSQHTGTLSACLFPLPIVLIVVCVVLCASLSFSIRFALSGWAARSLANNFDFILRVFISTAMRCANQVSYALWGKRKEQKAVQRYVCVCVAVHSTDQCVFSCVHVFHIIAYFY